MDIAFSPYELVARADGRRRSGVLLRVTYDDGARGHADLHPWTEFGDAPLEGQLASLAQGRSTPLFERSLFFARADAEARASGRSVFEGLTVPPSHASLPYGHSQEAIERAVREGYRRAKLKGWDFSPDDLRLFRESGLLFRLDFNARLTYEEVERLLDRWGDLSWIDWIEDPCPYDEAQWDDLRSRVRIAIDFERGDRAFDVRVVKPAREAPLGEGRIAVTSYLDHPLGGLGAAWIAAQVPPNALEVCGLVTHPVYEETPFSRQLDVVDTRLIPPDGLGFGFARELEALEWKSL